MPARSRFRGWALRSARRVADGAARRAGGSGDEERSGTERGCLQGEEIDGANSVGEAGEEVTWAALPARPSAGTVTEARQTGLAAEAWWAAGWALRAAAVALPASPAWGGGAPAGYPAPAGAVAAVYWVAPGAAAAPGLRIPRRARECQSGKGFSSFFHSPGSSAGRSAVAGRARDGPQGGAEASSPRWSSAVG